jgi:hypothetical protein
MSATPTPIPNATGVKGSDVYTAEAVGDPRVAMSVQLVRGASTDDLNTRVDEILRLGTSEAVEDLAVLIYQARDIRGGKGERQLFSTLMALLYGKHPDLVYALLEFIPEYGSWDDVFTIAMAAKGYREPVVEALLDMAVKQIKADKAALDAAEPGTAPKLSLVGKWAPREGKQFDPLAILMARKLAAGTPGLKHSQMMSGYRKTCSSLNTALKTVETFECSSRWGEIDPKMVPARAREMKKQAYLNETVHGHDLRHPDSKDRMACREHFQTFFHKAAKGEVKISGAQTLYPHEIIKKVSALSRDRGSRYSYAYGYDEDDADSVVSAVGPTKEERDSLVAVWNAMVAKARESGGLGKTIAMCDFSGSMQSSNCGDTPYWVSMAMGLLISEVTAPEFKDTFLSFDSQPTWHTLPAGKDIFERVRSISGRIGQGTSTDFQKALDQVLQTLKAKRVRPGDEPKDLIVITDMGFDAACASHETSAYTGNRYRHAVKTAEKQTAVQMAREAFKRAGEDMWGAGSGWQPPRIVIWNVAATYSSDFQASAHEEGVIQLSGWSPSLFKVLCEEGARVQTPYEALRVQLDDERYGPVREKARQYWAARV